jgi:hypothetical protein
VDSSQITERRAASGQRLLGLAAVGCACGLLAAAGMTPAIASARTSIRPCNRAAFTGRVGPARPAVCRVRPQRPPGPRGAQGHPGARGPKGFAGLPGPGGPPGTAGPSGATGTPGAPGTPSTEGAPGAPGTPGAPGDPGTPGAQGIEGPRGFAGLIGLEGPEGPRGFSGLPGPEGAEGLKGSTGETGPKGSEGPKGSTGEVGAEGAEGPKGSTGEVGAEGAEGPKGSTGEVGAEGAEGPKGSTGEVGPKGSEGPSGPAGPEGPVAPPVFAEFYALMPPDNAATVGAGIPVEFPQTGPTTGDIVRQTASKFVLPSIGTYRVSFSVSADEPGQLAIALNTGSGMVELPYTVYGRAIGTSLIAGDALVTTSAANSVLEVRNPAGNTPALTITPKAGGTHAAVASLVIQQLR